MKPLPAWAEDVLGRFGPQPASHAATADPVALANYGAITARFRRRWTAELAADVWPLFGGDDHIEHREPAMHLLGLMIDMARYGSRDEMAKKRTALADVGRIEGEVRDLLRALAQKLTQRAGLTREHLIEGGFDDDLLDALDAMQWQPQAASWQTALWAARAAMPANEDWPTLADLVHSFAVQSWREPRLHNSEFAEAMNSRKTTADAANAMLLALDRIEGLLMPVKLTDRARAAIFNVAHDTGDADQIGAGNIKTLRARLRAR